MGEDKSVTPVDGGDAPTLDLGNGRSIPDEAVTIEELADDMNVSTRTLRSYVANGMPRLEGGKFGRFACLRWAILRAQAKLADRWIDEHR